MNELVEVENKAEMTSLKLVKEINIFREQEGNRAKLQHSDLLKIIRNEFDEEIGQGNISQSSYVNSQNKKQPMFDLTYAQAKQILLKESKFVRKATIKYIEKLENRLVEITNKKMLLADLFDEDKMVVVNAHKKLIQLETQPLLNKIKEDKPMVDFANIVSDTSDTILIREFCKLAQDENFPIGERKLYTWLRKHGLICKNSTEPTQKAMNLKIFKVVIRNLKTPYGDKMSRTTKVTGKGQIYLMERLRKELIA